MADYSVCILRDEVSVGIFWHESNYNILISFSLFAYIPLLVVMKLLRRKSTERSVI